MKIIKASEWTTFSDSLPPITMLLEPLIPAVGKTLLHGPPGSGKSALMWGIGNAVAKGESYLGLNSVKTKVLLISTDMNVYELKHRWGSAFIPLFDILAVPGFDVTKQTFKGSETYLTVKSYVESNGIGLVMVDALGGIHSGRSAREDEVADEVDHKLSDWFGHSSILLLGHDRKLRYNKEGEVLEPGAEDFLGSQKWRANMTSQLHMWPTGDHVANVKHDKSQVSERMSEPVKVYIDLHGKAELWDEHRAQDVTNKYRVAVKALGLENAGVGEQIEAVAKHYGKSERTVKRWRSLMGVTKGGKNVGTKGNSREGKELG